MRIFPPKPDYKKLEEEGFTVENDTLKREWLGQSLANLVIRADDALVIALDAPWGEGKTYFIRQWRGHLKNKHEVDSIYLDAFANDYRDDPFSILAEEINNYIEEREKNETEQGPWPNVSTKMHAIGAFLKKHWGSLSLAGTQISARVLSTCASADPVTTQAIAEGASATVEQLAEAGKQYFKDRLEFKKGMEGVREALTELGSEIKMSTEKPLVFIIDELDRCRPDFALDLIECIKHVFSVPGIVFLLSYNGQQMESYIMCRYGQGVKSDIYLRKFVDVSVTFPAEMEYRPAHKIKHSFIDHLREKMGIELKDYSWLLKHYVDVYDVDLRSIEKILTRIALVLSSSASKKCSAEDVVVGICILSVCNNNIVISLERGEPCWEAVNSFFQFDGTKNDEDAVPTKNIWRVIAKDVNNKDEEFARASSYLSKNFTRTESVIHNYTNALRNFIAND